MSCDEWGFLLVDWLYSYATVTNQLRLLEDNLIESYSFSSTYRYTPHLKKTV